MVSSIVHLLDKATGSVHLHNVSCSLAIYQDVTLDSPRFGHEHRGKSCESRLIHIHEYLSSETWVCYCRNEGSNIHLLRFPSHGRLYLLPGILNQLVAHILWDICEELWVKTKLKSLSVICWPLLLLGRWLIIFLLLFPHWCRNFNCRKNLNSKLFRKFMKHRWINAVSYQELIVITECRASSLLLLLFFLFFFRQADLLKLLGNPIDVLLYR